MKNKVLALIAVLVLGIGLVACGVSPVSTEASGTKKENTLERVGDYGNFEEWRDKETGVQYFLYTECYSSSYGCAITPRYNADGTLYVD